MADRAQSTTLNLLTRDGGICATFIPALTTEQYDQLLAETAADGDTESEMTELLRSLAGRWKRRLTIDPC